MKTRLRCIAGAFCLFSASVVHAVDTSNWNVYILSLGVNNVAGTPNQNRAYFTITSPLSPPNQGPALTCPFSSIVVDLASTTGRALYSQLMLAKATGQKLSRIDYNQPGGAGTPCLLTFAEVT